jgi:hypothetical protein
VNFFFHFLSIYGIYLKTSSQLTIFKGNSLAVMDITHFNRIPHNIKDTILDFVGVGSGIVFGQTCKSINELVKAYFKEKDKIQIISPIHFEEVDLYVESKQKMIVIVLPSSDFNEIIPFSIELNQLQNSDQIVRIRLVIRNTCYSDKDLERIIVRLTKVVKSLKKLEIALVFDSSRTITLSPELNLDSLIFFIRYEHKEYSKVIEDTFKVNASSGHLKEFIIISVDILIIVEYLCSDNIPRCVIQWLDCIKRFSPSLDINDFNHLIKW